ncbi:hypothetical protein DB776_24600, partial [Xanthomonas perforans]
RQPGLAQPALGHVLVHRDRRAQYAGAHERQVGHTPRCPATCRRNARTTAVPTAGARATPPSGSCDMQGR